MFRIVLVLFLSVPLVILYGKEKEGGEKKPYSVSMTLGTVLGQGIFVYDEYARDPYLSQSLSISPSYILEKIRFGASISASTEHTKSNGATYSHQIFISDLGLSASRPIYSFESIGLNLSGSFGLNVPLSLASQKATLILGTRLSLSASKSWGKFSLSYSLGLRKNFHKYKSPVIRKEDLRDFETFHRSQNGGLLGDGDLIATGGNNVSFGISNSLSASYGITDKLSFYISLAYSMAFKYDNYSENELSGKYSREYSYGDVLIGSLGFSYSMFEHFSASFGMSTAQAPKTADQRGFNFPWFNFSRPAGNVTVFYLNLTASF